VFVARRLAGAALIDRCVQDAWNNQAPRSRGATWGNLRERNLLGPERRTGRETRGQR